MASTHLHISTEQQRSVYSHKHVQIEKTCIQVLIGIRKAPSSFSRLKRQMVLNGIEGNVTNWVKLHTNKQYPERQG